MTFFANARVFDGSGRAPFAGEVLIKGNRVAAVAEAGTLALHVDAVWNNTKGDYKTQDLNPRNPATGIRPDLTYGRIDQVQPAAELRYRAVYTKLERRFANKRN